MELVYEISGDQIDGARDYQEDAFLVTFLDDDEGGDGKSSALVIMADGMGGHAAGNIASNLVVSTFNKTFTGSFGNDAPPEVLRVALAKANGALSESIRETPALDGMGCTMVTAVLSKGKAYWVSVGDSHLYLIRDRQLLKQNEDHSYGGYLDRMKEQGIEVEAESGLSRNMLMSAMTGDEIAELDCPDDGVQLLPGDRLLICSDGLDTLSAGVIIQTSAWSPSAKECVAAMLKAVEDASKPRQDNTTVVVIDVAELKAPVAPAALTTPVASSAPITGLDSSPSDAGDTQEMTADEIQDAIAERGKKGKSSNTGLLIVIAVLLLAVLGAAVFYFLGGMNGSGESMPPAKNSAPAVEVTSETEPVKAPMEPSPEVENPPGNEVKPDTPPAAESGSSTTDPQAEAKREAFSDAMTSGGEGPEMMMLPRGEFLMGAKAFSGSAAELPRHKRTVAAFAMSLYEVTISQYQRFASASNRTMPNMAGLNAETTPMLLVSWEDANAYANWMSKQTGKKYRLPTEAQWEYAARAGTDTAFWWGHDIGTERAHCFDCNTGLNPRQPSKVGRFAANPFGLFDTSGNVMEWTRDCFHNNYKGAPDDGSLWEGGDCNVRVVRGGAYGNTGQSLRNASRAKRTASKGTDETGIRLVRDP